MRDLLTRVISDYAIARPSGRGNRERGVFGFSQNYIGLKPFLVCFIFTRPESRG